MIPLVYDKTVILLPENADEITGKQLIGIAGAIHGKGNDLKKWLQVLRVLMNKSLIGFYLLNNDIKWRCLDYIGWTFEDLQITRQLIPEYKGFYGPKSELVNLTLSEFYFTELHFSRVIRKNDDREALENLVSVLYRRAKPGYDKQKDLEGDVREPFNSNASEYYAKAVIRKWPMAVKQAILMWYDSCRAKIAANNPAIFDAKGGGETDQDNDADMFGILRGLAGGKYGDFEKVEKMLLGTALLEMNFIIAENERLQAEIEKQKH